MRKSFYHYMMKHRDSFIQDDLSSLARQMYEDHSFPKHSISYDEISSYLEMSGMLTSMSIFDRAWEYYSEGA